MRLGIVLRLAFMPVIGAMVAPSVSSAHHSITAIFDSSQEVQHEGIVREVRWINPHVSFDIEVFADGDEIGQVYTVETASVSALRGRNIVEPFIATGDRVRVLANPARRETNALNLLNVLLASGEELVLSGSEPRFGDIQLSTSGPSTAAEGDGSRPELGIFRVWSTTGSFPFLEDIGLPELAHTLYPLTDSARTALEAFDQIDDSPLSDCAPKGMPTIMEQPYPTEFIQAENGDILLRLEEYDTERRIHMNSTENPANRNPSLLGFSQGHWDSDTLIVQTSRISWPWFDTVGISLDSNAVVVERFRPTEDGSRLDLSITVVAPETFTRPVEVEKFYLYVPGVEVQAYQCIQ